MCGLQTFMSVVFSGKENRDMRHYLEGNVGPRGNVGFV